MFYYDMLSNMIYQECHKASILLCHDEQHNLSVTFLGQYFIICWSAWSNTYILSLEFYYVMVISMICQNHSKASIPSCYAQQHVVSVTCPLWCSNNIISKTDLCSCSATFIFRSAACNIWQISIHCKCK